MRLPFLLLFCSMSLFSHAQKVMQIERYGSPKTEKIFIGTIVEYQLKGEESFRTGYIEDYRVEEGLIQMGDYFIKVDEIAAMRFERGWARTGGNVLMLFGAGWSGFALLGNYTDGDPDTNYRTRDALISLTSLGLGYGISRLFRYEVLRFNDRRWLRLLDLSFKETE